MRCLGNDRRTKQIPATKKHRAALKPIATDPGTIRTISGTRKLHPRRTNVPSMTKKMPRTDSGWSFFIVSLFIDMFYSISFNSDLPRKRPIVLYFSGFDKELLPRDKFDGAHRGR